MLILLAICNSKLKVFAEQTLLRLGSVEGSVIHATERTKFEDGFRAETTPEVRVDLYLRSNWEGLFREGNNIALLVLD